MMYKCEECKNLFEEGEEKLYKEDYGEEYKGCPICGGAFEEAKPCKLCGGYSEKFDDLHECCESCKTDLLKRFQNLLHNNFYDEEIEMLNELYDGEEF